MGKSDSIRQVAELFLAAVAANEPAQYEQIIGEAATLRIYGWQGFEAHRSRRRVVERLRTEWSAWLDPSLETLSMLYDGGRAAVEFRIQATEHGRYVEFNRSAFLAVEDGQVLTIDLYCSQPVPSGRRRTWQAPASLSEEELNRLLDSNRFQYDARQGMPINTSGYLNLKGVQITSGSAHPSSNFIFAVRWSEADVEAQIEEVIAYHRQNEKGFTWLVGPYDRPSDLGQRLERHGLILVGDQAIMARRGLDQLEIAVNPQLEIEQLDGTDEQHAEAALQILAEGFQLTQEQIDLRRVSFMERLRDPLLREEERVYLAWLGNKPVAYAGLQLRGSTAHLSGATTLPAYRGQRIYSTLLKKRLEEAREYGHQIATIDAQPMSRRIVKRYGFKEFAKSYLYAWMPVVDMDVIRSLVPSE